MNRYAQDIQPYSRSDKQATTLEGRIRHHLPGGQDKPIPHWVPDDPEEYLILGSTRATPHQITMPDNKATEQHNAVRQQ